MLHMCACVSVCVVDNVIDLTELVTRILYIEKKMMCQKEKFSFSSETF